MQYGSHNWICIIAIASVPVSWRRLYAALCSLTLTTLPLPLAFISLYTQTTEQGPQAHRPGARRQPTVSGHCHQAVFLLWATEVGGVSSCAELTLRTFPWKRFCWLCFNIICKRVCFIAYNSVLALEKQIQICDQQSQNLSLVLLLQK